MSERQSVVGDGWERGDRDIGIQRVWKKPQID